MSSSWHRTGVWKEVEGMNYCWNCKHYAYSISPTCWHPSNLSYTEHSNFKTNYRDMHFISEPSILNADNHCKQYKRQSFFKKMCVKIFDLHA